MPLTLIDAAEEAANRGEERLSELILQFGESMIMRYITFLKIAGGVLSGSREERLPEVNFRGINEPYREDAGETAPFAESTKIFGGDLDVDISLVRNYGEAMRRNRENMKARAMALKFEHTFIKGSSAIDSRQFNGLQTRVPISPQSTQLIFPGGLGATPSAGGDALKLKALDYAIKRTRNATHWVMNQYMSMLMTEAARATGVSGFINYTQDQFGRPVTTYAGLPIIEIDEDAQGNEIMPFEEENPGGGEPNSTSIYCVSLREDGLTGIHNMPSDEQLFMYADFGHISEKPVYRTRVESELAIASLDNRSITRIAGITRDAVTA